jgi:Neuraminidase (sialidase)
MRNERFLTLLLTAGLVCLTCDALADWSPSKRLTWNPGESWFPAIAVDSAKAIHVVWEDHTPGNAEIYYKRSTDGGSSWGVVKRLTFTPEGSYAPDVAVDSSDTIHVFWGEYVPGIEIFYTRSTDGGTSWSAPKGLTSTFGWSGDPDITIFSDDSIHVTWGENPPGEIYYFRSTDGGANWSTAQRLSWNAGLSRFPAIDSGSAILLVWADETPGNADIYCRRSTDGGVTWNSVQKLTWSLVDSYAPDLAIASLDTVCVVWGDRSPINPEIFYRRSTDGGVTWGAIKRLTWMDVDSYAPVIARDSNDALHVIWHDSALGDYEIFYKSSSDGGNTWGSFRRLTWTSGESVWPAIAVDSDDMIHVVWQDDSSGNKEIYYRNGN